MYHFDQIYQQNLDALQNLDPSLHKKLTDFQENSIFEAVPYDNRPCNIFDTHSQTLFFHNTYEEDKKSMDFFYPLREHNFLYFFGIGNGHLQKTLLENPKHHLTVIEPSLELLFVALHLEDFSNEIATRRLVLFLFEDLHFSKLVEYFNQDIKIYYARSYNLHISTSYYETYFENEFIQTNKLLIDAMEFIITNSGNDIKDALMGLEHHIYNLPRMVAGTQFQKFIQQKNAETVIMVSTGPSLTKQLPLLKSIQKNATIICADSALRILHQHDITPDICVSLERIEYVAELFRDLPTSYKKNVIFVRASLEHKCVFETIEGCHDILVMRPYKYNVLFGSDPYGILCSGTSVANMAHELSAFMNYKTCIIIGQDLAYGENGKTHSKGHILGEKDSSINEAQEKIKIPAYGGEGTVLTNQTWLLFRNGLIQTVNATKESMLTINATEGGARIEGTVEIPFKKAIEKYINKDLNKETIIPIPTSQTEATHYYAIAQKNIENIVQEGKKIQKTLEEAFLILAKECKKLENKSEKSQLKVFKPEKITTLLDLISNVRAEIMEENIYFQKFYWEIMQATVVHYELELANIKIRAVNSPDENTQKALEWIFNHSHYFYNLAGAMDGIIFTILKAQKESLEEFPEHLQFLLKKK